LKVFYVDQLSKCQTNTGKFEKWFLEKWIDIKNCLRVSICLFLYFKSVFEIN
jgi:hypothetical protein